MYHSAFIFQIIFLEDLSILTSISYSIYIVLYFIRAHLSKERSTRSRFFILKQKIYLTLYISHLLDGQLQK